MRSDSLAVLMDRISEQAPHLFTTPGALSFVISQAMSFIENKSSLSFKLKVFM